MQRLWRPALPGGIHVCGCGHSGTSILTRLIGAHPRIHAIPGESGVAKKQSYRRYRQALEGFWADTAAAADIWVEKTPKHVRHLAFILNAAPSSRSVLISRDPRDCVASLQRRYGRFSKALRRWRHDNGRVWRPRVQSYDSTFGLDTTDRVCLHINSVEGCYGGLPANKKFDDSKSYWIAPDASIDNRGWASVPVPNTGTTITVKSVSAQGNFMQVQVNAPAAGKK